MPRFHHDMPFGAAVLANGAGVRFRLYAPGNAAAGLIHDAAGPERTIAMREFSPGWFEAIVPDARAGTRYGFHVAALEVPDPASRFAPGGVYGRSEVIDPHGFEWPDDDWQGRPWNEHVLYELHVGTFTPDGTYAAAGARLPDLADLGITAIELMPLAQAPGARNWGYDGVQLYAPSCAYGRPEDLKAFVAAAHGQGISVFLDVVYNHFGPEANDLHAYAKAFYTEEFHTPWGAAIDVAGEDRADVRAFFIENAVYWLQEYRFDGLRLDAVHQIYDRPQRAFLRRLASEVLERTDRTVYLILENERNEAALLDAGYRAQWNDDAHHAVHVAITGQTDGYYANYASDAGAQIARTLTQGFGVRGEPSAHLELGSFVVFLQNHDQVGNRPFGDRITSQAPAEAVRAASATLLLAPGTPLLFMGEEWGASTPFQYFGDFEPELARAVTAGRRNEFAGFAEFADPAARERIPDPESVETFRRSILDWSEREREPHRTWLAFYRDLLRVRREEIAPRIAGVRGTDAGYELVAERAFRARWRVRDGELLLEANFSAAACPGFDERPQGRVLFATHAEAYPGGVAPAWSVRWSLA